MSELSEKYGIPKEITAFVNNGFLEVSSRDEEKRTVEFDIPSVGTVTGADRFTLYSLIWIHPNHNAEFCHYYEEEPGDLPNFYVRIHSPDARDEQVEDLNTVDDLADWLSSARDRKE